MIKGKKKKKVCRAYSNIKGSERYSSMSQLSHLSLIDEHLKLSNLSPDLVLFADEVMDTLGQLLLGREEGRRKKKRKSEQHFSIYSELHRALYLLAHTQGMRLITQP